MGTLIQLSGGGSSFVLEGTNYLSVLAQGTPEENGQALKDAYAFAQTMTPNGAGLGQQNRVVILLAPGLYSFNEAVNGQFIVNTSYIDFESLSGHRDVYFSSIEVLSPDNGIDVRLSGIDTTAIGYYFHSAFAVSSAAGLFENIIIKDCKGGDYSFSSFSSGFLGLYENCEAFNYSFGSPGLGVTPPPGITGIPTAFLGFFNNGDYKNCSALDYSFCSSDSFGISVQNAGTISGCTAGNNSFCFANASISASNGVIENCTGQSFCFVAVINGEPGTQAINLGRFSNCRASDRSFCFNQGSWSTDSATGNYGQIIECHSGTSSFVSNVNYSNGENFGLILNCSAIGGSNCFCGSSGLTSGNTINCVATQNSFSNDNAFNIFGNILRCTLLSDTFTVGATGGGRVVLGIDTTGIVNY